MDGARRNVFRRKDRRFLIQGQPRGYIARPCLKKKKKEMRLKNSWS
jgi:hypothetical protein